MPLVSIVAQQQLKALYRQALAPYVAP